MSSAANCIPIPVCCEPAYGYSYTQNEFFNSELTGACPSGYLGGPFVIQAGNFASDISQADADAQAAAFLATLIAGGCVLNLPIVTSETVTKIEGSSFSYQIVATNHPTSYGATSLPSGLSVNTSTGVISGTLPSSVTTYAIPISATNASGTGNGTLTVNAVAKSFRIVAVSDTALPATGFFFNDTIPNFSHSNVTSTTTYPTEYNIGADGSNIGATTINNNSIVTIDQVTSSVTVAFPYNLLAGWGGATGLNNTVLLVTLNGTTLLNVSAANLASETTGTFSQTLVAGDVLVIKGTINENGTGVYGNGDFDTGSGIVVTIL